MELDDFWKLHVREIPADRSCDRVVVNILFLATFHYQLEVVEQYGGRIEVICPLHSERPMLIDPSDDVFFCTTQGKTEGFIMHLEGCDMETAKKKLSKWQESYDLAFRAGRSRIQGATHAW